MWTTISGYKAGDWQSSGFRLKSAVLRSCCVRLRWYVHLHLQQLGLIYRNRSPLFWEINSFCHQGPSSWKPWRLRRSVVSTWLHVETDCDGYHALQRSSSHIWWTSRVFTLRDPHVYPVAISLTVVLGDFPSSPYSTNVVEVPCFFSPNLSHLEVVPLSSSFAPSSLTHVSKAFFKDQAFLQRVCSLPEHQSSNTCWMLLCNLGFTVGCLTKQAGLTLCFIRDTKLSYDVTDLSMTSSSSPGCCSDTPNSICFLYFVEHFSGENTRNLEVRFNPIRL